MTLQIWRRHNVDQAIICSFLTAEPRVLTHDLPCVICGRQIETRTDLPNSFINLMILNNLAHFVVTYCECKEYILHSLLISSMMNFVTNIADTLHRNRGEKLRETKLSPSSHWKENEKHESYSRSFIINMYFRVPYFTSSFGLIVRETGQCTKQ
jgi:hypothetical protein